MCYLDIHSHILPGVDDGPHSDEQSKHMLEIAYQEGFKSIVVTPHYQEGVYSHSIDFLKVKLDELTKYIHDKGLDIQLLLGSEIFYSHGIIDLLNAKRLPTLAESRYVLIEFIPSADYRYIKNGLNQLQLEGYLPILAHVERYRELKKDLSKVKELVDMGIYLQVNAMSIDGSNGLKDSLFTHKLLRNNCVHFLATDCHSDRTRAPRITKAVNIITKKYGGAYKDKLLIDNPMQILANQYID